MRQPVNRADVYDNDKIPSEWDNITMQLNARLNFCFFDNSIPKMIFAKRPSKNSLADYCDIFFKRVKAEDDARKNYTDKNSRSRAYEYACRI